MGSNRYLPSDELLEKIFFYMENLFEEKDLSETLMLLTDLGKTLVNSDRASFWFWDQKRHEAWTLAASDIGKIIVPENTGLIGTALMNNQVIVVNEPYNDPRFNPEVDRYSGYITKSILTLPITNSDNVVIGAYQAVNKLDSAGNDIPFTDEDTKRLALAATFCGKTLESYLLYSEAHEDQLTGLKNRRGLYSHYEKYIAPTLTSRKASLIICDIDHFKKVNDTYGHNAGDAVLKQLADIFTKMIGIDDGIFRWGGEEFILLLPGKDPFEATEFAELCRQTIEKKVFFHNGNDIRITMSFGVCELDRTLTTEENVQVADSRLYYAKANGRNQVVYKLK